MTTSTLGIRTESFANMTRVFAALRRTGRLVDMTWFQENAEYARAVLSLAEQLNDPQINDTVLRLRQQLQGFLDGRVRSVAIAPEARVESVNLRVPPVAERRLYATA
jgi:hypothetical protein